MAIKGLETINYEERAKDAHYKKRLRKVMTEKEAVETILHNGDSFCMGGFVMWRQPEAIMREIARQGKINSDLPWVKLVDWTNFEISLRLMAGEINVPFMPCRSSLGTDIPKYNKDIKVINDPYENKPLLLIPAYKPDVAFISVQKADRRGNGQIWGFKGTDYWKARAAKHVVLLAEEIVPTEKIYENPGLTVIPAYCTDAVVHLPFNCHPAGCFGCYTMDGLSFVSLLLQRQSREGALKWIDEWVYGPKTHFGYCDKIGWEKLDRLAKAEHKLNNLPG